MTNRVLTNIGIFTTISYAALLYFFTKDKLPELGVMPLNELGDFLSGSFGPLAIFWLILGFLQQGKELNQNTQALELQTRELRNTVEHQKELVEIAQRQYETDLSSIQNEREKEINAAKPKFVYSEFGGHHSDVHQFSCNIVNKGASSTNIEIDFDAEMMKWVPEKLPIWENGETVKESFAFKNNDPPEGFSMRIKYVGSNSAPGEERRRIVSALGENGLPQLTIV